MCTENTSIPDLFFADRGHLTTDIVMKIGNLALENNTILAPLAGISNLPFRLLAKEAGCGLVCSEMVNAIGLVRNSKKSRLLLTSLPQEKPLSVQIFGSDPAVMAEAATIVEAGNADIVDINFGCSVKKVVKTGAGVDLMRTPQVSESLLRAVRKAVRIPVTIKIRTGWDKSGRQAFQLAEMAESSGVDAIAVHPRTATQGFAGPPDWSIIAAVKARVNIPVIGNGDVFTPDDAVKMLAETGCDAVMIGRKAIENPWIFSQVLARMHACNQPFRVTLDYRFAVLRRYLQGSVQCLGEEHACRTLRRRLGSLVKGLPHSSQFRKAITHMSTQREALELIDDFHRSLTQIFE